MYIIITCKSNIQLKLCNPFEKRSKECQKRSGVKLNVSFDREQIQILPQTVYFRSKMFLSSNILNYLQIS